MRTFSVFCCLLLLALSTCSKKEPIPGLVGKPIHLAPVVEKAADTLNCKYRWSFTQKPDGSRMDALAFQPTSQNFNIYFIPDKPGDYKVQYIIYDAQGTEKSKFEFLCQVEPDTGGEPEIPPAQIPSAGSTPAAPTPKTELQKPSVGPAKTPLKPAPTAVKPQPVRGKNIPKISGKYTIQISSWKTFASAEQAITRLQQMGLDAYIQKAFFNETKETWYRVRTGTFDSYEEASSEMTKLKVKLPKEQLWIDTVRKDQE